MPFQLFDPDEQVTISINGNAVTFRRLSHGDNLRLMNLGARLMKTPTNELADEAAQIMAGYISSIEVSLSGLAILDIIGRLTLNDFLALMGEMTAKSTLSEGQIKN